LIKVGEGAQVRTLVKPTDPMLTRKKMKNFNKGARDVRVKFLAV
jgi:hypothetical protein